MIAFNTTPSGGRSLRGDTAYGRFIVVWDKDSNIIQSSIEILEPAIPPREARPVEPAYVPRFTLPGQQLTAIFKAAGIETKPGCKCKAHAMEMDRAWIALEKAHPDAGYKELMTRFVASHGATIVGWLTAEAIRSKVVPNPIRLWAAIKEVTQTQGAPP